MKKLFKDPLIHFLVLGTMLFVVYGMLNIDENKNEIIIDDNLINELSAKWELKRDRNPNLQELMGLINQYVEQEVLYREALAMNLDHNDEIVKRRLAQKMEFISDGLSEVLQPTEKMSGDYFNEHKENYKKPSLYTLEHVYFKKDKRPQILDDVKKALASNNPKKFGDYISLNTAYENTSSVKIARDYGTTFAVALDSLPIGKWAGPVYSGFGVHIVYISKRIPAGYFTFNEVADKVTVDYNYDVSNDFKKELISSLLSNYTIDLNLTNDELKKELNEKF